MTLYEINADMREAIDAMLIEAAENNGEVSQETADRISELKMAREDKLEAIGCYIKNTDAEREAIDAEIKKLQQRKNSLKNKSDGLKWYVARMLNGEKWECPKVSFSFIKSTKVQVADETKLARKYFRKKITFEIDKDAIKQAIKSGKKVRYASLVETKNLQIK